MIGAMPAVAVRHERRKKGAAGGGKNAFLPNLRSKPNQSKHTLDAPSDSVGGTSSGGVGGGGGGGSCNARGLSPMGSQMPSANASRQGSRAGSPDPTHVVTHVRYGDECFFGKVSLLHFIIFFLLGGLTVIVVGAVQFKQEAGLGYLRFHFLVAGAVLVIVGVALVAVKCAWFRVPIEVRKEECEEDDDDEKEGGDERNQESVPLKEPVKQLTKMANEEAARGKKNKGNPA